MTTNSPRVLFCSLSNRPEFSEKIYQSNREYFNRYNIDFIIENKVLCDKRCPAWSKILLLQRELEKDYDYVVWIDDDILITNHKIDFKVIINMYDFDNILIDNNGGTNTWKLNSGIFVCKNNVDTKEFLKHIWSTAGKYHYHNGVWENDTMNNYHVANPDDKIIKIIPHRIMQSFTHYHKKGDFAIHFAGINMERRMKLRDEYLSKIIK